MRTRSVPYVVTMRACLLLCLCLMAASLAAPAPARSNLQLGDSEPDQQPFVEEVVVESVLQVHSAPPARQPRTDTRLQDGATVARGTQPRN